MTSKGKSNITKFRQDKRLAVVGALRSLALLGLLATTVFCIFVYREDFSLQNIGRIVSYLKAAGRSGEFQSYSFESGLDSVYVPFEAGLAVVSGNMYRYVTALPEGDFSVQFSASRPAISAGERQVLLYDRGGKSLALVNGYAQLWSQTLESPIISAEINEQGEFCVVTDENGYRSAVTMYSARGKELYKWYTSEYFVMLASPAPDGKHFSALCLRESEGKTVFTLRGYSVSQEEPVFSVELSVQEVYSVRHNAGGDTVLICDDGVYIYDDKGHELACSGYERGTLRSFSHHQGQMPCLALQSSGAGEGVTLRALDEDGGVVFEKTYEGSLRALDGQSGQLALLLQSKLVTVDCTGAEPAESEWEAQGARDVVTRRDGRHILIYADRAELVDGEEEAS